MINGISADTSETIDIKVFATKNRGHTPEELAQTRCLNIRNSTDTRPECIILTANGTVYEEHIAHIRASMPATLVDNNFPSLTKVLGKWPVITKIH